MDEAIHQASQWTLCRLGALYDPSFAEVEQCLVADFKSDS